MTITLTIIEPNYDRRNSGCGRNKEQNLPMNVIYPSIKRTYALIQNKIEVIKAYVIHEDMNAWFKLTDVNYGRKKNSDGEYEVPDRSLFKPIRTYL